MKQIALLVLLLAAAGSPAATVEQVINREDPKFDCAAAAMSVGRDGNVYLGSNANPGYVLRASRDGKKMLGGDVVYALVSATANKAGVIATANAHFNHSINIYDAVFRPTAVCSEFLVNDQVQWDAPGRVDAGDSGDFYGLDQHRDRIVRVNISGKVVHVYPLPPSGKDPGHIYTTFRVCEAQQVLAVMTRDGALHGLGFDGEAQWTLKGIGANFTIDDAGVVYSIAPMSSVVKRYSPDGQPLPNVHLQTTGTAGKSEYPVTAIDVFGGDLVIKRADPTELFRVYDLASGKQKTAVSTRHERLTAEFPSLVWTADKKVPLKIALESSPANGHTPPEWHVWLTPLGDSDWRELKWSDGQVTVPTGWAGLYQLKIAPLAQPTGPCEYLLQDAIEVRLPDSRGTVSVWTVHNRVWFGRGDEITIGVLLRAAESTQPQSVRLELRRGASVLWSNDLSLHANTVSRCNLGKEITRGLADGRYQLVPILSGYTCVVQPLKIGPGIESAPPFRVMQYGDYSGFASAASVWDFADTAEEMLQKSQTLGVNQYVNRSSYYPGSFANNDTGLGLLQRLTERTNKDANGTAAQKVDFGFPEEHALGAMGAHGVREMLLLVGMDGGLPLGTLYDKRTPEQFEAVIKSDTRLLAGLPGFYGWAWAANWWADADKAFKTPEQKTAYQAALTRANDTGAWSPILDEIGDRRIQWQVEAQTLFKKSMDDVTPHLTPASSGPYRRPEVYPPVSFANVDEVDLHYQAEQITTPDWTAHAVDYYQRPGKPTWIHPELSNDSGTGEQILPMLWLAIMRGVNGIGISGNIPNWGDQPIDNRAGYAGVPSVFMAINRFANHYGPWLDTLHNDDRVAIVVSSRQVKLDAWGGVGGLYFTRLWEAYQACLLAHCPATFLYTEDVTPQTWKQFKAVLIVDQRFEMEPELAALLAEAKKQGVAILADETCRDNLVKEFIRLPVAFNHIEKISGFNADHAFWQYPDILLDDAPIVAHALTALLPPVAMVDQPRVLVSRRRNGDAQAFWIVNNSGPVLNPGLLWRVGNGVSTCLPTVAHAKLPIENGEVVYDVFGQREVSGDVEADLRYSAARLYVVLPHPIKDVKLRVDAAVRPGGVVHWTANVPGIDAPLPMHLRLMGGGVLLQEQFTTTGEGTLTVPTNAAEPLTLAVTELISGQSAQSPDSSGPTTETDPKTADTFGPRLRDMAISRDGSTALINAFDWGTNLYAVDLTDGKVRWRNRIGQHFAYAPAAAGDGFVAQGYDFKSGEGYHLYQLDSHGGVGRRFALDGLPARLTNWAFSPIINERINNFAVADDGSWVASAGNLGLAVWSHDGRLLWSQDWSKSARQTRCLLALDKQTLIVADGITLAAFDATTGKQAWSLPLASAGEILGINSSADSKTIAARVSTQSGRVVVVRAGVIIATLPTAADDEALTPDGSQIAIAVGDQLKWYDTAGGLRWAYNTEGLIRFVRLSVDGRRIVGCTTMGDVDVFNPDDGTVLYAKRLAALAAPAWLPGGDLVLVTWMGDVCRLDAQYKERWRVKISGSPSDAPPLAADVSPDATPTVRVTSWSNAEATGLPLTPNLINPKAIIVRAKLGDREMVLHQPIDSLFDGKSDPPAEPWLDWSTVNGIDSGWMGSFSLEIDTFRTLLHVTAITLVEDPAHPESWIRDAKLEYWDPGHEKWVFAQYLTADAAVHTHKLEKPIDAARIRLTRPDGLGWPQGNLRLGEIVLHGETLGASHPDVIANKPVAVLFDEQENDLASTATQGGVFQHGGAYSGGSCIRVDTDKLIGTGFQPPFGHAVPNWDFNIVEKPAKPGEYRWLQFACKAIDQRARGLMLLIGPEWPGGGVALDVGEPFPIREGFWVRRKLADETATEWMVVRVDLWEAAKKDFRVRCINFAAVGGPTAFDQILLARNESDLPKHP